jgi:iron complex outermembrane recepter protein
VFASQDDLFSETEGKVITPTRLKQNISEVPAAVTVITREMIATYGIQNVTDALRWVPGMQVTQVTGNDFRVNYHGTNILIPRRMTLLLDGVSMYRPGLGRVDWKELPVNIDDIERIEVTRGSNSAAYGPNSMLAIINVISKNPNDVERSKVALSYGSRNARSVYGSMGRRVSDTVWRASVSYQSDQGFDELSRGANHDNTSLGFASFKSATRFTPSTNLDLSSGVSAGTKQVAFADVFQATYPDQKTNDFFVSAQLSHTASPDNELMSRLSFYRNHVNQQWVSCSPKALLLPQMYDMWFANRSYAVAIVAGKVPSGGTANDNVLAQRALEAIAALGGNARKPVCASPNQNLSQYRLDWDAQDTFVASPFLRGVVGIGARYDRGDSDTFLGRVIGYKSMRAFGHAEYKPTPDIALNAGMYLEKIDGLKASVLPRLGLNYALNERNTLRAILSNGTRSPDMLEREGIWSYSVTDFAEPVAGSTSGRFYQSGRSSQKITPEKILNRELGYVYNGGNFGTQVDFKIFHDRLTGLISEKLSVSNFNPSNKGSVTLSGAEIQSSIRSRDGWQARVSYAYLDNKNSALETEKTQYSRHSGSVGVAKRFSEKWSLSGSGFYASGDGVGESAYRRFDVNVKHDFSVSSMKGFVSAGLSYLDTPVVRYYQDRGSFLTSKVNDRSSFMIRLQVAL